MPRFLLLFVLLVCGLGVQAQSGTSQPGAAPNTPAPKPSGSAALAPGAGGPAAPAQPIAFNHKLHIDQAKMSCNDCHEPSRTGATLAMPQPSKCMLCHAAIATDKPEIKLIADAAKNNETISWVRVYRVPSFVTFSHKTHTSAGNKCEDCHGDVSNAVAIAPVKDMSMGGCIACHQNKGAAATCDTCHQIMSRNGHTPFDADAAILARLHVERPGQSTLAMDTLHRAFTFRPAISSLAGFLHAPQL